MSSSYIGQCCNTELPTSTEILCGFYMQNTAVRIWPKKTETELCQFCHLKYCCQNKAYLFWIANKSRFMVFHASNTSLITKNTPIFSPLHVVVACALPLPVGGSTETILYSFHFGVLYMLMAPTRVIEEVVMMNVLSLMWNRLTYTENLLKIQKIIQQNAEKNGVGSPV